MVAVQYGSNDNLLDGWINFRNETDGDITKPLAFEDNSVDRILLSHVLEHVHVQDGYRFLRETHRILKPGGVIRVIVPDLDKVWRLCNDSYRSLIKEGLKTWWPAIGRPAPAPDYVVTDRDAVETLLFCHGHEAAYTEELLITLMETAGFDCAPCDYGQSQHPEFAGVDLHHIYIGLENCRLESCVVEGTKPDASRPLMPC